MNPTTSLRTLGALGDDLAGARAPEAGTIPAASRVSAVDAMPWRRALDLLRGLVPAPQEAASGPPASPQGRPWEQSLMLLAGKLPPPAVRRFTSVALRSPVLNVQEFIASSQFD